MKKLKNLNLHHLSQAEMTKKEMNALKGGSSCECSCSCLCGCPVYCPCNNYAEGIGDAYYGSSTQNLTAHSTGGTVTHSYSNSKVQSLYNSLATTFKLTYDYPSYV